MVRFQSGSPSPLVSNDFGEELRIASLLLCPFPLCLTPQPSLPALCMPLPYLFSSGGLPWCVKVEVVCEGGSCVPGGEKQSVW